MRVSPSLAAPSSSSVAVGVDVGVDSSKVLKIVERMCGMKGVDEGGGVRRVRRIKEGEGEGQDEGKWQFSGASAVRWLLDEGLADRTSSALFLCHRMQAEGWIVKVRGRGGFYLSPSLLYAFDRSVRWTETVTPHDVERLHLDQQPHHDIIQALCQHYNNKQGKRRNSRGGGGGAAGGGVDNSTCSPLDGPVVAAAAAPPSPALPPGVRRSSVHRSSVFRDGLFLGSELVRWLKRKGLCEGTRDGIVWGNFLLQRHIIQYEGRAEEEQREDREEEGNRKGQAQKGRSGVPTGFRAANLLYSLQPRSSHPKRSSGGGGEGNPRGAPPSSPLHPPSSPPSSLSPPLFVSSPPSLLTACSSRDVNGRSSSPSPPEDEVLIPMADLLRRPSLLSCAGEGSEGVEGVEGRVAGGAGEGGRVAVASGWEFVQSFGDDASSYDFADADDLVTAVQFDSTGEHLAIGDKAGRVSIVQEAERRTGGGPLEYRFYTEFQSHEPEFDSLKSSEISPRIAALEWWPFPTSRMTLLTANEKTIKVWRIDTQQRTNHRQQQHSPPHPARAPPFPPSSSSSSASPVDDDYPSVSSRCVRVYRGCHVFSVHSLSASCDGSTFLAADDLKLLLYDIQHSDTAISAVDLTTPSASSSHATNSTNSHSTAPAPTAGRGVSDQGEGGAVSSGGAGVDELLTVARFHPGHPSLLCHGSSSGTVRIADLRVRLTWDTAAVQSFTAASTHSPQLNTAAQPTTTTTTNTSSICSTLLPIPGYYRAITDSILDVRWQGGMAGGRGGDGVSGHYLISRDYLQLRVWDLRRALYPVYVSHVHPHLLPHLPHLLETEALFDSFQCAVSPSGRQVVTGSYSQCFTLHSIDAQQTVTIQAKDDAREPDVVHSFHNPQLHTALHHQPPPHPLHLPSSVVRSYVPPLPSFLSSSSSSPSSLSVPTCPLNVVQKVLKVAWHPRWDAVAVAGLYKLFLYQHQPT